ncbi:MAG: polysaccharide biosynthesis C-terminal domain-containing protein [Bacteroidales bacterium]|nr:polysaccharide biosynthesis C-terminal domain-containing protein [Bacteroidales bacterium]
MTTTQPTAQQTEQSGVKRRFVLNLLLLLLLNALVKPMWMFGIDRSVQNTVGANAYGIYYALLNLSLILNMLLDLGLTGYNNRALSRNPSLLGRLSSRIASLKTLLALLYTAITLVAFAAMGYQREHLMLVLLLIANQFMASFILYLRSNLNALQHFVADSLLSVLDKLLCIALCGLMLWGNISGFEVSISNFALAQSASYLITMIVAAAAVAKLGAQWRRPNATASVHMLRRCWPFALLSLLMATYYHIDVLMVERLCPNGSLQAGIYAQAIRLYDAYAIYPYLVSTLLLPIFGRMLKQQTPIGGFTNLAMGLILTPALSVALPTIVFAQPLMELLYVAHSHESAQTLSLLMLSYICLAISYVLGTLLTAHGAIRQLNWLSLGAVILSIAMQLTLVPWLGIIGAAIGRVCVLAIVALTQTALCLRLWPLRPKTADLLRYAAFVVLGTSTCLAISHQTAPSIGFTLCVAIVLLLAFVLRIIKLRDLRLLL